MRAELQCAQLRLDIYRIFAWLGLLYLATFGQYNNVEYLTPAAVVGIVLLLVDIYFDMRSRRINDGSTNETQRESA